MEVSYLEAIALQKHEIIYFRMGVMRDEGVYFPFAVLLSLPQVAQEISNLKSANVAVYFV